METKTKKSKNNKRGFELVEMIVYVAVLTIFSLIIVQTIVAMSQSLREIRVARDISSSASLSMERITRELRTANDIDSAQSVLNDNPGKLMLLTTDISGTAQTVSFFLENGSVNLYENDILTGSLTSGRASTTKLIFRSLSNGKDKAVKVEMTIASMRGSYYRTENFYSTVILRNSQ